MSFSKAMIEYYNKKLMESGAVEFFMLPPEAQKRALEQRIEGIQRGPLPAAGGKRIEFRRCQLPDRNEQK